MYKPWNASYDRPGRFDYLWDYITQFKYDTSTMLREAGRNMIELK